MQLDQQPATKNHRSQAATRSRRHKTNTLIVVAAMVAKAVSEIWHTEKFQTFLWDVLKKAFCPPCK